MSPVSYFKKLQNIHFFFIKYLLADDQCGEHNKRCLIAKVLHGQCSPKKRGSCGRADTQHCCPVTEGTQPIPENVTS